jgi:hypothetical protein
MRMEGRSVRRFFTRGYFAMRKEEITSKESRVAVGIIA